MIRTEETRVGFRLFTNHMLTGVETKFLTEALQVQPNGTTKMVPKEVWLLKPDRQYNYERSRYMPHQGTAECARRRAA